MQFHSELLKIWCFWYSDKNNSYVCEIESEKVAGKNEVDSYGHRIAEGQHFISGNYLERIGTVKKSQKFKQIKKAVCVFL